MTDRSRALVVEADSRHIILDSFEAWLLDTIDRVGWAQVHVAPTPNETFVRWTYTIGLSRLGHPELVVLGLPQDVAGQLLLTVVQHVLEHGTLEHGALTRMLNHDYVLDIRPVDGRHHQAMFGRLLWFWTTFVRGAPLRVQQVVWPDEGGHVPDDPTLEPEVAERLLGFQPLLNG
jgi:Domain of unknown function (DUF4262)